MKKLLAFTAATLLVAGGAAFAQYGEKKHDHDHGKSHDHSHKQKHAKVGHPAPNFKLTDLAGTEHELANYRGKYVVLEWINLDCPFVRKHYASGNMQALQKEFTKKGVVWLSICSSGPGKQGHLEKTEIEKRNKEHKAKRTAYLIDAEGTVGRMYAAKTTPHMFVIDPEGTLIYSGGIDDKPSTKVEDIKSATNYVAECLNSAMAGEKIETKMSKPYGCSVKYASKEKTDA